MYKDCRKHVNSENTVNLPIYLLSNTLFKLLHSMEVFDFGCSQCFPTLFLEAHQSFSNSFVNQKQLIQSIISLTENQRPKKRTGYGKFQNVY